MNFVPVGIDVNYEKFGQNRWHKVVVPYTPDRDIQDSKRNLDIRYDQWAEQVRPDRVLSRTYF